MNTRRRRVWFAVPALLLGAAIGAFAQRDDPFQTISRSQDVAWLERVAGSLEAARALHPRGGLARGDKDLRTAAYARLGELGTKESLAAVERVEQTARTRVRMPEAVTLGQHPHPAWHFGDTVDRILAQVRTPDNTLYAVVPSQTLGGHDVFLTSERAPGKWTRPRLAPGIVFRGMRDASLKAKDEGHLILSWTQDAARPGLPGVPGLPVPPPGRAETEIDVAGVMRDTDGDGWTDAEERRLETEPAKADTDGDGLRDGLDPAPGFAPLAEETEETQILQRALFATLGMSDSRYLLVVRGKSPKVQPWGYLGPVLYTDHPEAWRQVGEWSTILIDWSVSRTGDEATVNIHDFKAPMAAGLQEVRLHKLGGKWVVTGRVPLEVA